MNLHYKILATFLFTLFTLALFGQSDKNKIIVPNLVGMTLSEAKKVLSKSNVNIGAIVTSGETDLKKDADSLIVYHQNPSSKSTSASLKSFKKNKLIDIWLSKNYSMDSLNSTKPAKRKIINDFR
jgi:beta-lactam-binding protein with PASTA domain